MTIKRSFVTLVLAGWALGGCAAPDSGPESDEPATKVEVKKNAEYDSAEALKDAAVAGGYECGMWFDESNNWAVTAGSCEAGAGFATYWDRSSRDEWLAYATPDPDYPEDVYDVLVGPNWTIGCDDDCAALKKILGGKVREVG